SACSLPQLWPTIPGQPSTDTTRSSITRLPVKLAMGCTLTGFVRGSGASYIHPRGRWANVSAPENCTSQLTPTPGTSTAPRAPPASSTASPIRIHEPAPALGCSNVVFAATGAGAAASKYVNHKEPS